MNCTYVPTVTSNSADVNTICHTFFQTSQFVYASLFIKRCNKAQKNEYYANIIPLHLLLFRRRNPDRPVIGRRRGRAAPHLLIKFSFSPPPLVAQVARVMSLRPLNYEEMNES